MTGSDDNQAPGGTQLFERCEVAGLALRNRFVMAPMTRGCSPGGVPGPDVAAYYRRRADGGVGLIITEGTSIPHPAATNNLNIPAFHGTKALKGWARVVDAVHDGGAAIMPQLWHAGAVPVRTRDGGYSEQIADHIESDVAPLSPSGYLDANRVIGEPMTSAEIEAVITAFGDAAASAEALGFDGIELQGAHGYLIDQFLWADTNRRTDGFGGDIAGRTRFATMIVEECRRRTSLAFPIVFRFSQWKSQNYQTKLAYTPRELETLLDPLVAAGVDIFHCSQRRYWTAEFEGSDRSLTGWTKVITGKPTIIVGSVGLDRDMEAAGFKSGASAAIADLSRLFDMYDRGEFDLAAVGRSMLVNPDWCELVKTERWQGLRAYSQEMLAIYH